MKIELLTAAFNDLKRGRQFYEEQQEGLGRYFYDSLFSDIESLQLYAGVQPIVYGLFQLYFHHSNKPPKITFLYAH